ncbi:YcaQ family DNA glycosylase [Ktedonobacteria bacterium brp13]|nr:YcaQ family DNA glycosylase [Ktedonobacteria bacterium brp13]
MSIQLSHEEARRFLATYHFTQSDLAGIFTRLGTVQYDPLNPVGRNADLVLQARVPGYRVDDWQAAAYTQRLIYDAWDKQACLVPISDWSFRAQTRAYHQPYHDREILQGEPDIVEKIYAAIDARGPLSSQDFEDRVHMHDDNSWYGVTNTKRVLRSMWANGLLLTHHRQHGRHYYERPERVIPSQYFTSSGHPNQESYYRWIIARRYQAVGLLRSNAEAAIWSACGSSEQRRTALAQLVEAGTLIPVQLGEQRWQYYMHRDAQPYLDRPAATPRVIFLGPLDSLIWDRKAIQQLYNYNYLWEVYKPVTQRRWGYYVLPVFYQDRFIARVDSRLVGKTWTIARWWWEEDIVPDATLLERLRIAITAFMAYMGADDVYMAEDGDALLKKVVADL